jgi:hypothetical protein
MNSEGDTIGSGLVLEATLQLMKPIEISEFAFGTW